MVPIPDATRLTYKVRVKCLSPRPGYRKICNSYRTYGLLTAEIDMAAQNHSSTSSTDVSDLLDQITEHRFVSMALQERMMC